MDMKQNDNTIVVDSPKLLIQTWSRLRSDFLNHHQEITGNLLKHFEKLEEDVQIYKDFVHAHSVGTSSDHFEIKLTESLNNGKSEKETDTTGLVSFNHQDCQTENSEVGASNRFTTLSPRHGIKSAEYKDVMDKKCGGDKPIPTYRVYYQLLNALKDIGILSDFPNPLSSEHNALKIEYDKIKSDLAIISADHKMYLEKLAHSHNIEVEEFKKKSEVLKI